MKEEIVSIELETEVFKPVITTSKSSVKAELSPIELLTKVIKDTGLNERGHRFGKCLVKTNPVIGGYSTLYNNVIIDHSTLASVATYISKI